MDAKNREAIRLGPEWMLWKFANLPAEKPAAAVEEFCQKYGELHPGLGVHEYQVYARIFQHAWQAKTGTEKKYISRHITAIFERDSEQFKAAWGGLPGATSPPDEPRSRPAVVANFNTGTVTVEPRTLLDWLADSLLKCRNRLAVCERKGCDHPYFVKSHARQRFCTPHCADSVRQHKKEQWWAENRDRFIKKWRQERKASRRGKRV